MTEQLATLLILAATLGLGEESQEQSKEIKQIHDRTIREVIRRKNPKFLKKKTKRNKQKISQTRHLLRKYSSTLRLSGGCNDSSGVPNKSGKKFHETFHQTRQPEYNYRKQEREEGKIRRYGGISHVTLEDGCWWKPERHQQLQRLGQRGGVGDHLQPAGQLLGPHPGRLRPAAAK